MAITVLTDGSVSIDTRTLSWTIPTLAAGDVVLVAGITWDQANTLNTPTGSGLTFPGTPNLNVNAAGRTRDYVWAATAASGGSSVVVTCSVAAGGACIHTGILLRLPAADGYSLAGTPNTASVAAVGAGAAPSVSLSGASGNVGIVLIGNWNGADLATRAWLASATEDLYARSAGDSSQLYGHATLTGSSTTLGLSGPTGNGYSIGAIEVLKSAGGTTHALASTGTGTSTGSLAVSLVQKTSSSGTGTSTGSINLLLAPGAMSATGTGQTGGSVNLLLAPAALSASGSGQTDGSATLSLVMAVGATGTGQTAGSADLSITVAPLALAASGTGQTGGSLDLSLVQAIGAAGSGSSTGSLDVNLKLACSSAGSGITAGSASLVSTLQVAGSGTGQTGGQNTTALVLALTASGTGTTTGSLDVTLPSGIVYQLAASGSGTTAGSLAVGLRLGLVASGSGATGGSVNLLRPNTQIRCIGTPATTTGNLVLNLKQVIAASGSAQTTGSADMRISRLLIAAAGYSFTSGSCDLKGRTYTFRLPTHEEPMRLDKDHPDRPLAYFRETWAISLVNISGTWTPMRTPPPSLLAGKTNGVDYFIGGYEYVIDQQTARSLALAGYPSTLI